MNIKETLITFGTVTILLLTVRFLITKFISNNLFVSLGIMASISISLLVLSKKGKLGWWGAMFLRQMTKNQKGKRAIFFYGEAIFMIIILTGTIYAINVGSGTNLIGEKRSMIAHVPELQSEQKLNDMMKNQPPLEIAKQILLGLVYVPIAFIYEFPKFAVLISAMNDAYHGWILNFYSTTLIEYLQLFGMLVFYRVVTQQDRRLN